MFNVQHGIIVFYDSGVTFFKKDAVLPFPPYVGLSIADDAFDYFDLVRVGWVERTNRFITQANIAAPNSTLEQVQQKVSPHGWIEDVECRTTKVEVPKAAEKKQRSRKSK